MFDKYRYNLERQYNLVFNISKSGLVIVLSLVYIVKQVHHVNML